MEDLRMDLPNHFFKGILLIEMKWNKLNEFEVIYKNNLLNGLYPNYTYLNHLSMNEEA